MIMLSAVFHTRTAWCVSSRCAACVLLVQVTINITVRDPCGRTKSGQPEAKMRRRLTKAQVHPLRPQLVEIYLAHDRGKLHEVDTVLRYVSPAAFVHTLSLTAMYLQPHTSVECCNALSRDTPMPPYMQDPSRS